MHGSIAHLLGNMFFLYVFGDNLEGRFGHFKYLLLYILWGVLAAFAHSIYAVSTGGGNIPAIGASGAISGVMGAYLIFFPHAKIHTIIFAFFITTVRIPAIAYIPFWFVMQLVFALIGQSGGVAYLAHIGGFLIGLLSAYLWKLLSPRLSETKPYPTQAYKPRSASNAYDYSRSSNYQSRHDSEDTLDKPVQPEIISGENFVDVILEDRSVSAERQLKVEFNKDVSTLNIRNLATDKITTVIVPIQPLADYIISDISVKNGIIKIRLI